MKVKSESEVAQLCPTPCDHRDSSLPGSSVHGIFQARILGWGPVILEPKKIKSVTVFIVSPSICHEVMGLDAMILVF